jgi:predicted ATP-dependent endonuclease of OLD family
MILKKVRISNFRGVNGNVDVNFGFFNTIVGQNDAGKSTVLKAIDAVLNDTKLLLSDFNSNSQEDNISIELYFDCENKDYKLGEEIETTIESEELVNEENLLVWKKYWAVSETKLSNPKTFIVRKKYSDNNDFIFNTEKQLIAQCKANEIETSKGNGEEFNNVRPPDLA